MAAIPPVCDFGWKAPEFTLPATTGKIVTLSDVAGPKGLLVMFVCNHCPYVRAVLDRIVRDARELMGLGVGVVAISSNDAVAYPQDGFDKYEGQLELFRHVASGRISLGQQILRGQTFNVSLRIAGF